MNLTKASINGRLFGRLLKQVRVQPTANVQNWKPLKNIDYEWPPFVDSRKLKLPMYEKRPLDGATGLPNKMTKSKFESRGPELVHNKLIHKQFGIQALDGGRMMWGHFEMLRNSLNKKLDSRMFALYRVPAPWLPYYRKGVGVTLGGGKPAKAHAYTTPVRANRIIIELGGNIEFFEVNTILDRLAKKLPFDARVVSQEMMEKEVLQKAELAEKNLNPFSFKHCLDNNFNGCSKWVGPYDYVWYGEFD